MVTDTIVTPGAALLEVAVPHSDGKTEVIQTTDEHPFWVETDTDARPRATAAPTLRTGVWRRADELSPGNRVTTLLGYAVVLGVTFTNERQTVFNLSVKDIGTFHVGTDGVLVHNCDYRQKFIKATGKVPENVHHRIPQDYKGLLDDPDRIHDLTNLRGVSVEVHMAINQQWRNFKAARPNPTLQQVEEHAALLDGMFGHLMIKP